MCECTYYRKYKAARDVLIEAYEKAKEDYLDAIEECHQIHWWKLSDKRRRLLRERRRILAIRKNTLKTLVAQLDDRVDCKMKGLDWYPKQ